MRLLISNIIVFNHKALLKCLLDYSLKKQPLRNTSIQVPMYGHLHPRKGGVVCMPAGTDPTVGKLPVTPPLGSPHRLSTVVSLREDASS